MKSRKRYLDSVPIEDAMERWMASVDISPLDTEMLPAPESLLRITSRPLFARLSSPHYHAAAMDGIAVEAEKSFGASESRPVTLRRGEHFVWVDTGDPMPENMNAVIMSEDLTWLDDNTLEIIAPASPWQHVRPVGEDIVATELLFPVGHQVSPADIGALLAAGIWQVPVRRKPRVALIPTGDEIVEPAERLQGKEPLVNKGDIIESNSYVQEALVTTWGAQAVRHQIVSDKQAALRKALSKALDEADIVVLNAGSSAGSEDFTALVVEEEGEVLVHGIAQRPGKPVILGRAQRGGKWKPVIGVPGYPVSAYITFTTFVLPMIHRMLGLPAPEQKCIDAVMTRRIASPAGVEEFLRVKLGRVSGKMIASPISRGAGVITSIVRADGIVRVPRQAEGIGEGSQVSVQIIRPLSEIENTVVIIGSHDPGLDLLGSILKKEHGVGLSSSHTGSLGGLMALKRKEAHAAGTHLIDEATGEYNRSYIERLLPNQRILLVKIAERHQGLIVLPGNPRGIHDISDLARMDVRIVNRQRGAGTRVLLDMMLRKLGIDPTSVEGYEREEFTHTGVAVAVKSGVADCGMGVLAAARALGLDFVPVTTESYELAIPEANLADHRVKALLETIRAAEFRRELSSLGGYDTETTGAERWVES